MTERSAARHAQTTAFAKALRSLADWLEQDSTLPVPEYLPIVISLDSAEAVADIAIGHNLDGPFTAADGPPFLYRAFGAGVTWQAVHYANRTGMSEDEAHARAWAAQHGFVLLPRTDTVHTHHATGGAPCC
ncbi:hypothetical protein Caci_2881 [Catenulispora acidiphila DSM 44928]|uniref:Uncharacterized protein n=1 Tax=Catenulispora acidiphila (strain DSM 44928 / JCM 14897 / NBRC 102108 / NRRL B-24433 / ID139908) TaxID=479433 RepID=C7Q2P8_CATAD|nr:hypothetical protein [Catenulispora acidiphila]ACU71790.1 hypothetical protein Caci_2881 [Catenulispora acidiphila DSM 44928]